MTTMIMPVIIPVEEDKCPKCHRAEDIKKVCRRCGYEYKDKSATFWVAFLGVSIFLSVVAYFVAGIFIIVGGYSGGGLIGDLPMLFKNLICGFFIFTLISALAFLFKD